MKNNLKITAMVAIVFFAATSVSNAQYNRRSNSRMTYMGQCLNIPGLSDTQKTQVTEINNAHRVTIDNMREEFYDADDIISANEIKAKMTLEQNNHLNNISKVLTEEQLVYFNENIVTGPSNAGRNAFNRSPRGGRGNSFVGNGRGAGRAVHQERGRGNGKDLRMGNRRGFGYRGR